MWGEGAQLLLPVWVPSRMRKETDSWHQVQSLPPGEAGLSENLMTRWFGLQSVFFLTSSNLRPTVIFWDTQGNYHSHFTDEEIESVPCLPL